MKNTTKKASSVAVRRTKGLKAHLTSAQVGEADNSRGNFNIAEIFKNPSQENKQLISSLLDSLPNDLKDLSYNISDHLPGPIKDKETYPEGWLDAFIRYATSTSRGDEHVLLAEWQQTYGGRGLSSNIVIPYILIGRGGPNDSGKVKPPRVTQQIIIGDPEDARRIARMHTKKPPMPSAFFFNSIISTTNYEEWRRMREHFVTAFLPKASLRKIFPVSLERARYCPTRLEQMIAESPDGTVDISEFFLYETFAQLQLALYGTDNGFMDRTNLKFRNSVTGHEHWTYTTKYVKELLNEMSEAQVSGPATQGLNEDTVRGPLTDALNSFKSIPGKQNFGNAFVFAFAGHDTTGLTLTWLIFELAQNMGIQRRLQQEIDDFFKELNGRDMTYDDIPKLKYMTKCIMETLRLWPVVPNGTFREFEHDDVIKGANGENVKVTKGSICQITNYNRHRDPELWGEDVNVFNPDRDWKDHEIWANEGLKAYNPHSGRFSPFTFTPRDCIGKNFAHMEMRPILCYILGNFSFELSDAAANYDRSTYLGVNYGTMGPQDLTKEGTYKSKGGPFPERRHVGLTVKAIPRSKT